MNSGKKYFFGWTNIKYVCKQIYLTFSDKKSDLSSKKIERSLFVISALYCFHVWFEYHYRKLTYIEEIAVIGTLLGYAGFTLITTQKEKRKLKSDELPKTEA
jgi:Ca2+/Na+ antiporter